MTSISPTADLEKREDDHHQFSESPPGHRAKAAALVIDDDSDASSVDLVYRAKVAVLNDAIQEIGMGRYQWYTIIVSFVIVQGLMVLLFGYLV